MPCELKTFVGREPVCDSDGDPTNEYHVIAQCNGNIRDDCGWRYKLFGSVDDWWITSETMNQLHAAHRAGIEPKMRLYA